MSELIAFFREMFEASKERFKNPISRNFIISFLLFNWKAILVLLFSKDCIEDRISFIYNNYTNQWCIIIPLLFAIAYTILIDFVMWLFDEILLQSKKGRKNVANNYKLHALKKETSIVKAQLDLEDVKSRNEEMSNLNIQVQNLKEELQLTTDALNQSQTEKNKLLMNLNDFKKTAELEGLENNQYYLNNLYASLNRDQISELLRYYAGVNNNPDYGILNVLVENQLIHKEGDEWKVTKLGKSFAKFVSQNK